MKNALKKNKQEIIYNLINSALAGGLVMLGSLTSGNFSLQSCSMAFIAGLIVLFTKFKDYWATQKGEYLTAIAMSMSFVTPKSL